MQGKKQYKSGPFPRISFKILDKTKKKNYFSKNIFDSTVLA